MPAVRILVNGRVQGVGFRYFVSEQAKKYGISGEVWNRRDGGVEVIAEHERAEVLRVFVGVMNEGPGRVDLVESSPLGDTGHIGFRIGSTR